MIVDKTGRKLKLGQIVDIAPSNTMMMGNVIELNEAVVHLPGDQSGQPYVIVHPQPFVMKLARMPNGDLVVPDAYIIADNDGVGGRIKDELESTQPAPHGLSLVKPS